MPFIKVALGVSQQFFFSTREPKHNKNVETKQFSKVDVNQNSVSTVNFFQVSSFFKFLV